MAQFDLIVIGSGPGGAFTAVKAMQMGMKSVAVIEDKEVGGTCTNRGCMPTKTLMHSAHLLHELGRKEKFGLVGEPLQLSWQGLYQRKDEVVAELQKMVANSLKGAGVTFIQGKAQIMAPGRVKVNDELLTCEKILIATGSRPRELPIKGIDLPNVLTSDGILDHPQEYESMIIIGGGVIGAEFATIFNSFGKKVTIIEGMDRILPTMDKEISQSLQMILKKRGVDIFTAAQVKEIIQEGELLTVLFEGKKGEERVSAEGVLISIGRQANVEELCAPDVLLEMDSKGIAVNSHFETSIPHIYAIGDVVKGGIQLAHVAAAQGENCLCHMFRKDPVKDLSIIPSCVYTIPEIASVGFSLEEARKAGFDAESAKFPMTGNGKNVIELGERGFIKIIYCQKSEQIVGAQMMCPRATDMISEFGLGIISRKTLDDFTHLIYPHPTFSEGIGDAFGVEMLKKAKSRM